MPLTVTSSARSSLSSGSPAWLPALGQQRDLQVVQRLQVGVADRQRAGERRLGLQQASTRR